MAALARGKLLELSVRMGCVWGKERGDVRSIRNSRIDYPKGIAIVKNDILYIDETCSDVLAGFAILPFFGWPGRFRGVACGFCECPCLIFHVTGVGEEDVVGWGYGYTGRCSRSGEDGL